MCGAVLMVGLGKIKAEKKQEQEKAADADDPKAGAEVGTIVNLVTGDAHRVSQYLFFLQTSAHGIESLDLTNRIRILSHPQRYFTPSLPNSCLLTQPPQHHSRS